MLCCHSKTHTWGSLSLSPLPVRLSSNPFVLFLPLERHATTTWCMKELSRERLCWHGLGSYCFLTFPLQVLSRVVSLSCLLYLRQVLGSKLAPYLVCVCVFFSFFVLIFVWVSKDLCWVNPLSWSAKTICVETAFLTYIKQLKVLYVNDCMNARDNHCA